MKIAVMGTGGVGGYFGGRLAASAGNDVSFIARGAHLDAMRRNGLHLAGPRGDTVVEPVSATDDPGTIGPVELVLFCVKLYDTESAGAAIAPLMGPTSRVLTLQNGVDGADQLARIYGDGRVLAGAAYISAVIDAPGQIRYTSGMSRIVFGGLDGNRDATAETFLRACAAAGFEAEWSADARAVLWTKMVLLATNAGLSAAMRQPIRAVYDDPETRPVALDSMAEAASVAHALGVRLDDDLIERHAATSDAFPPEMHASMYYDLVGGRRLELDGLSGHIVRLGERLGIPTPVHRTLYTVLRPYKNGNPATG